MIRPLSTLKSAATLALILRSPQEWATWARDVAGALGDGLARSLGEPRPLEEPRGRHEL